MSCSQLSVPLEHLNFISYGITELLCVHPRSAGGMARSLQQKDSLEFAISHEANWLSLLRYSGINLYLGNRELTDRLPQGKQGIKA